MVVDTSAFVAIINEPDGEAYLDVLVAAPSPCTSALSVYETLIVLSGKENGRRRFQPGAEAEFSMILADLAIEVVPFDGERPVLAHQACCRFGRGFHRAALNLGDCAAYALAKERGESLLFKGGDFARTDITPALPQPA